MSLFFRKRPGPKAEEPTAPQPERSGATSAIPEETPVQVVPTADVAETLPGVPATELVRVRGRVSTASAPQLSTPVPEVAAPAAPAPPAEAAPAALGVPATDLVRVRGAAAPAPAPPAVPQAPVYVPVRPPEPPPTPEMAPLGPPEVKPIPGEPSAPVVPLPIIEAPKPPPASRRRPPMIPHWVWWGLGGLVGTAALIALVAVLVTQSQQVRVPSLEGLTVQAARTRLQELGLQLRVGDHRFSASAPIDSIIDQTPAPGGIVHDGSFVVVALSAGSESLKMPDVVGMKLDDAKLLLKQHGLAVEVQTAASDKAQGTVLESFPSAGVTIQTGDSVRLSVAGGAGTGSALLPTDLAGKVFVLDPEPVPSGGTDTTMDVARRVQALLEASNARVVLTRTATDVGASTTTVARVRKAKESSATAVVGFSVTTGGLGGLAVVSVPATSATESFYIKSISLSSALLDSIKQAYSQVRSETGTSDAVLTDVGIPAARVQLGSTAVTQDKLTFTDPQWADNVARAVYTGISTVYGTK